MKKKDKIIIGVSSLMMLLTLVLGYTYAFWVTKITQTDTNILASGCFNISLTGEHAIDLQKSYPITDVEGMTQTPYTFTITNLCSTKESYQVNLESLAASTFQNTSIKVALDDYINLYFGYENTDKYYADSKVAKRLIIGELDGGTSVTYNLRLWIDENAPESEQNKRFESKIVVTTITNASNSGTSGSGGGSGTGGTGGTGSEPGDPSSGSGSGSSEESNGRPSEPALAILRTSSNYDYSAFRSQRGYIKTISIDRGIDIPEEAGDNVWDIGVIPNQVMSYMIKDGPESSTYTLHIQSNSPLYANEDMSYWFAWFTCTESISGLELLNTSRVTNMTQMFKSFGSSLETVNLNLGDNFDTSNVTNMEEMFAEFGNYRTKNITLNLGSKFNTSKVTNMKKMFYYVGLYSENFALDLGENFDTSNVTDMSMMFYQDAKFGKNFTLNLGDKFDTSNVTNMTQMFMDVAYSNESFTLDLGDKFNTSNVTIMDEMFIRMGYNTKSLTLNLGPNFDMSRVTSATQMFLNTGAFASDFTLDLGSKFDLSALTSFNNMFVFAGYQSENMSLSLDILSDNIDNMRDFVSGIARRGDSVVTLNYSPEGKDTVDQYLEYLRSVGSGYNIVRGEALQKHTITLDTSIATSSLTESCRTKGIDLTAVEEGKKVVSFVMNGQFIKGNHFNMLDEDVTITNIVVE